MQQPHSFEYAIIRVVPKVEREEFLNVGVILYCKTHKFLQVRFHLDESKLRSISPVVDLADIREHLRGITEICDGASLTSPIAKLDMPSRFRWLTATRSTMVQNSKVHPGICDDPGEKLARLFQQYVM